MVDFSGYTTGTTLVGDLIEDIIVVTFPSNLSGTQITAVRDAVLRQLGPTKYKVLVLAEGASAYVLSVRTPELAPAG